MIMEQDEFIFGLHEVSEQLSDLLVEAEENKYIFHDAKVFKLLSKAYLAIELAIGIKVKGDAKQAEEDDL
jgi:hypothetical protein